MNTAQRKYTFILFEHGVAIGAFNTMEAARAFSDQLGDPDYLDAHVYIEAIRVYDHSRPEQTNTLTSIEYIKK